MMGNPRIAAQLYTVRDFMQTAEDLDKTAGKIKAIGYNAVQVSGIGPMEHDVVKDIMDKHDLYICATHIGFDRMRDELDDVIYQHKLWDCKYVGIGGMPEEYSKRGLEGYKAFAKDGSEIAGLLKKEGLQFIYHNHAFEFVKFDGVLGMEVLLNESDPDSFGFEIDTYWVQAGGCDPVDWIERVKGRMQVVHFKDMAVGEGNQAIMAEVGEGNLNWPKIIKACKDTGVEWAAVEQDICQRDPFESLEISINNLKDMGLES